MTTAAASIAARSARREDARKRRSDIASAAWLWMEVNAEGLNVDQLLSYPSLALRMCRAIAKKFPKAGEREICSALLWARKSPKFQTAKRAPKQ